MCPLSERHFSKKIAAILSLTIVIGVLQMTAPTAAADISDSFEDGDLLPWQGNMNYDWAFFDVSLSSIYAYDGVYSVKMQGHGLPQPTYPKMTVWIERQVRVPASSTMNVGLNFHVYNENSSFAPEEVLVYFGDMSPVDYPEFTVVGRTNQTTGWKYFEYQTTVMTSSSGWLTVALGFYNSVVGFRSYFFDMVTVTGVSDDWTPPAITNLQPLNQTMISDSTPPIAASYSDSSGIEISSVILKVDTVDVTVWATVTGADVSYTPSTPMADGVHNIYLEVRDSSANRNKAAVTWWFRVDSTPPLIGNLAPTNHTTVSDTTPAIGAGYSDANGVNMTLISLEVDSVDVTSSAVILPTSIDYTPVAAMTQGLHSVRLSVSDMSNPPNRAVAIWQFTVDSLGPLITNLRPADSSTTSDSTPLVAADYSDPSLIDTTSVMMRVDGVDVTSSALVTLAYIWYNPASPLSEGDHLVYLEVRDDSPSHVFSIAQWTFIVDSLAPTITNLRPSDGTVTNDASPLIAANYFDDSGIATAAVVLEVDSVNVTSSATVTATGVSYTPSTPLADGLHNARVVATDASPNHLAAEETWSFTTDISPPTTSIQVLSPSYLDTGTGKTYVSSITLIRLTADDGNGAGIQKIEFLYYGSGETPPSYGLYTSEFAIPSSKADGQITVRFMATDLLGNVESAQTVQLYLDNTPPAVDAPGYSDTAVTYLNNALEVMTIEANDDAAGIGSINYDVDDSACQQTYSSPLPINVAGEGEHRIYFKAADRVGNAATVRFAWIFLDTTPPTADAGIDQKVDLGASVQFDGTGSSDGSGSGIDNYTWSFTYGDDIVVLYGAQPEFAFEIRGSYEIELRVRDRAGNTATDSMRVTFNEGGGTSDVSDFPWWMVILAAVIAAILLAILLLAMKRKKEDKASEEEALGPETVKCPSCGRILKADDEFCSKCGKPLQDVAGETPDE